KIVEFGMRMAGDRARLLAMLEPVDDLARESAYFARNQVAQRVTAAHVGRPSRVTATVALGQAGVINIEREARMSGSTHDKGIMILSGFMRARFGQQHPIAMSASICFEQSYSGIDGDSASSTELYALMSALSGVPIRQDLAVTGSVDQYGTVQAIGGV